MSVQEQNTVSPDTVKDAKTSSSDLRMRHIVERVGDNTFSRYALCGKKMTVLLLEHGDEICQKCVDIQRNK